MLHLKNKKETKKGSDSMKILLIGNSFSYYWTDELYRLLAADGKDDAVVANIYYSGCAFNQHVDWWKNNVDN